MRVKFWGVRGAVASPGRATADIGGNTACVEVRSSEGGLLVLDAGIGLYWLGRSLLAGPHGRGQGETTILLSRTHWDHIQGLPFFVPAFLPGNKVHVHGAPYGGATTGGDGFRSLRTILEGQMREVYSPLVSLANMPSITQIVDVVPGKRVDVAGVGIQTHIVRNVVGDATVSYRIEEDDRVLAYVSSWGAPADAPPPPALVELAKDADVLVHEAFYTREERARIGQRTVVRPLERDGHATFEDATDLALAAKAKRLLFTYHHPDRDDAGIAKAVAGERVRARGVVVAIDSAREGVEILV